MSLPLNSQWLCTDKTQATIWTIEDPNLTEIVIQIKM